MLSASSFLSLALTLVPMWCSKEMTVVHHIKQEEVLYQTQQENKLKQSKRTNPK